MSGKDGILTDLYTGNGLRVALESAGKEVKIGKDNFGAISTGVARGTPPDFGKGKAVKLATLLRERKGSNSMRANNGKPRRALLGSGWYVLQTQPSAEYRVKRWLERDAPVVDRAPIGPPIGKGFVGRPGRVVIEPMVSRDFRSKRQLERGGYEIWLPECVIVRAKRKARSVSRRMPIFPGYVFIKMDLTRQAWRELETVEGVEKILCEVGGLPARLDESRIAALLQAIADDGGLLKVGLDSRRQFKQGEQVRILSGPFADLPAIYSDNAKDRHKVLVEMFGRPQEIVVDEAQLSAAS